MVCQDPAPNAEIRLKNLPASRNLLLNKAHGKIGTGQGPMEEPPGFPKSWVFRDFHETTDLSIRFLFPASLPSHPNPLDTCLISLALCNEILQDKAVSVRGRIAVPVDDGA